MGDRALGYPEWSLTHDGFPPRATDVIASSSIPSSIANEINEDSDGDNDVNNEDNDSDNDDDNDNDSVKEYKGADGISLTGEEAKAAAKEARRLRQQQYRQLVRNARDTPLVLASFHRDYIKRLQVGISFHIQTPSHYCNVHVLTLMCVVCLYCMVACLL
jgi:hypothetical protein